MLRRLVGSDVGRGGDLSRFAAIAVTKPPEPPWTRRRGSHAVAQRRSASVDAGLMRAQASCITGAPRPLQALPEPMTLFRRSTRPWASVRVLSQCG